MGEVYKARDTKLDRDVALDRLADEQAIERIGMKRRQFRQVSPDFDRPVPASAYAEGDAV